VAHGLGLFLYLPAGLWSERQGPARVLKSALSARLLAFMALFGLGFVAVEGRGWLALTCFIVVVLSWSLLSVSGTAHHIARPGFPSVRMMLREKAGRGSLPCQAGLE
jgi:hypothetical protein